MAIIEINKNSKKALEKLREDVTQRNDTIEMFQERIAELELALEDYDYQKLTGEDDGKEFAVDKRRQIERLARLYWLKNPLIKRAVYTQTSYVFGQGVDFEAENDDVNEIIQDFLNDPKNKQELTGHQSLMTKETELQLFGNVFLVFFVDTFEGKIRVRSIPVNEIEDIITDPEDSKTVLYYKRRFVQRTFDESSEQYKTLQRVIYYPDINNENPTATINKKEVSDAYVYHIKTNVLSDMKFGVSEIYAAIDWAKAYNQFLTDWASLTNSLATFAWKAKTSGGKGSIKQFKKKLDSTVSQSNPTEKNPARPAGSTFIAGEGQNIEPIKTQGVAMKATDGDKLVHMVCAATGIFYHYLMGDPSTGNLATAKAMERPMEIKFNDRQNFWIATFKDIFDFVIRKNVESTNGKLSSLGSVEKNQWDEWFIKMKKNNETGEPISTNVNINMPELLEKDINNIIQSIVTASTMNGNDSKGYIDDKEISRMLLMTLGVDDVDEKLEQLYPENGKSNPQKKGNNKDGDNNGPEENFRDAVRHMKDSLQKFAEKYQYESTGS